MCLVQIRMKGRNAFGSRRLPCIASLQAGVFLIIFSVSAVHEGLCQAQAVVGHGGQTQPPTLLGVGVFIVVTAFLLV